MILYFILISSVLHSLFFPLPFPIHLSFPSPLTTTLPFPPLLLFPYFLSLSLLTHEIWKIIKQNLRNTNSKAVKIILKAWMLNNVLNFHTCMPGGWITLFFQRKLTDPNPSCRDLMLWLHCPFTQFTHPKFPISCPWTESTLPCAGSGSSSTWVHLWNAPGEVQCLC